MEAAFGEYKVQYTNEKFKIGSNKNSAQTQEEKELAAALDQIR